MAIPPNKLIRFWQEVKRRKVIRSLAIFAGSACMIHKSSTILFPHGKVPEGSSKPNILFIMLDDLGKEWISCYGADDIGTPHVDALSAGGMKFQNAYSMPQCTPSRATLLTGTYPWRKRNLILRFLLNEAVNSQKYVEI